MSEYTALITARGGSKGLPRKNVLSVGGKPLIAWTIEAALKCPYVGSVFVSTDDEEIARVSLQFGAEVIQRPPELSTDTASSIDAVSHAIEWLEGNKQLGPNMILLQPTSPLRTTQHLSEAVETFCSRAASFVISVFEPTHTPIKSYIELDNGTISGLYSDDAPYQRRQDLPRALQPNGAIYIFAVKEFIRNNSFPRKNVFPYIMSEKYSIDIDTLEDLIKVEQRLKES